MNQKKEKILFIIKEMEQQRTNTKPWCLHRNTAFPSFPIPNIFRKSNIVFTNTEEDTVQKSCFSIGRTFSISKLLFWEIHHYKALILWYCLWQLCCVSSLLAILSWVVGNNSDFSYISCMVLNTSSFFLAVNLKLTLDTFKMQAIMW